MRDSALRWSAPAPSGARSRKTRSTASSSRASKSIGLSSRANMPVIDEMLPSLPCGMAMPWPTPVEPSRSRCRMTSKISLSDTPVSLAALAANSCNSCFLEFTLRAGITASCCSKSAKAILFILCATRGWRECRCRRSPGDPLAFDIGGVDPTDIAVVAAIDNVQVLLAGAPERKAGFIGHVQRHHCARDRHREQLLRTLRDDGGGEVLGNLVVLFRNGIHDRLADFGRSEER